ncbi:MULTISPECIES: hypothetical protein [unclassified Nostoc]|uniref:hypothetical protein n=1 Tax=unclassified Nostoc TaxID=2593658 RepID=UPI0013D47FC3|nr:MULTISPECIES: hypothetical protein [unclassified Nostoc]MBE8996678.1 hypothetical protein [Nostoc sp. LEGE 12447]NEU80435.1 hypothetical protein [Nostoc sp. UIC 10630]
MNTSFPLYPDYKESEKCLSEPYCILKLHTPTLRTRSVTHKRSVKTLDWLNVFLADIHDLWLRSQLLP